MSKLRPAEGGNGRTAVYEFCGTFVGGAEALRATVATFLQKEEPKPESGVVTHAGSADLKVVAA